MSSKIRLAVCGCGEHGKETVSKIFVRLLGLRYVKSTSQAAAELVFEHLKDKYGYITVREAWEDRRNHRKEWFDFIREYNGPEKIRLYREMLAENDILDGIRDADEVRRVVDAGLVEHTIWVDASKRLTVENTSSCNVSSEDCMHVIDNNGSLEELESKVHAFIAAKLGIMTGCFG